MLGLRLTSQCVLCMSNSVLLSAQHLFASPNALTFSETMSDRFEQESLKLFIYLKYVLRFLLIKYSYDVFLEVYDSQT